jgi:hypothetical protein
VAVDEMLAEAKVVFQAREEGGTRADLLYRGRSLSHLVVEPQIVR